MTGRERHAFSPAELSAQLSADRAGVPYLLYRDGRGDQRLLVLEGTTATLGREADLELFLPWDAEISRVHARLEQLGGRWTVVDDGLSRNGTFVNGRRIASRGRLAHGDRIRVGRTELQFRDPDARPPDTATAADAESLVILTPAQQQVLVALCRPMLAGEPLPATNPEIATALHLSVEAVRSHLKSLFARFEVPDLPQNRKRAELARRAIAIGAVAR